VHRSPLCLALAAGTSFLLLASCTQEAAPAAAAPEASALDEGGHGAVLLPTMACGPDGFFQAGDTQASIRAKYEPGEVREETVAWADSEETALVLYPDEPATRVEMLWFGEPDGPPLHARASGEASQWIGPAGLFIGATLEDVEAANGGPFELMGFQNHNAGEVTDWLGGKLDDVPGSRCYQGMRMDIPDGLPEEAVAAVSGDPEKRYRSDSPEMRAAKPVVAELSVGFTRP
jgi:hypothetical protein